MSELERAVFHALLLELMREHDITQIQIFGDGDIQGMDDVALDDVFREQLERWSEYWINRASIELPPGWSNAGGETYTTLFVHANGLVEANQEVAVYTPLFTLIPAR